MARILLVHQPTTGGVARHVRDVALRLDRRGYEVFLCATESVLPDRPDIAHAQLDLHRAVTPLRDLRAVASLTEIVRRVRPDIVHAHSSKAGAIARLARAGLPSVPLIYTPHGYAFAGYFSSRRERVLYRRVEHVLGYLTTRVVCVCEAEAGLARLVTPVDRIRTVPNGIAAAQSLPDAAIRRLAAGGLLIGALIPLRPGKGVETLIDAVPRVIEGHPDARFVVFGDGPEADAARARASARGLEKELHFAGHTTSPLAALSAMDIFIHPSWAEAFPYSVLEAMSLGKPVVATNVGGVGEAIVDGSSGILVPPRNSVALGEAVNRLLDDPSFRVQLGKAAAARIENQYTLDTMINRLCDVYDDVLSHDPAVVGSPCADSDSLGVKRVALMRDQKQ